VAALGCGGAPTPPGNVLLLIADDVGVDRIGAYAAHPEPSQTPNLDALAARGVRFDRAWATPMCSPSRAAMLTGRLPFRNGVGAAIHLGRPDQARGLALDQTLLPRLLGQHGIASFAVGKWHLAGGPPPDPAHARKAGFSHYTGYPGNPPGPSGYFAWTQYTDDTARNVRDAYLTSAEVDATLARIVQLPEPWFGWVGFHAVHAPLHAPPQELHGGNLSGAPRDTPRAHYDAELEALDREIGRLLAGIDPAVLGHTTVIFVADNGTSQHGIRPPTRRGKRSLYEAGIRVPLIVAGPPVPPESAGRASDALVHVTDLFATIAGLFGVRSDAEDSQSLLPYLADPSRPSARATLYTERFLPNGGPPDPARHFRAVRDARYKLIVRPDEREFYDLQADPHEQRDLLAEGTAPAAVVSRLESALVP